MATTSHSVSFPKAAAHRQWQASTVIRSLTKARRSIAGLSLVDEVIQ